MMTKLNAVRVASLLTLSLLVHAATAAEGRIPRLSNGHPDFSGIWQTTSAAEYDLEPHSARPGTPPGAGVVEGGVIPGRRRTAAAGAAPSAAPRRSTSKGKS